MILSSLANKMRAPACYHEGTKIGRDDCARDKAQHNGRQPYVI